MNRQRVFTGALLVQAGLGSILSWAMLFTRLHETVSRNLPYSNCDAVLTSGLIAFAAAVLVSGILAEKIGPRKLAFSSGLLVASGFILGSVTDTASMLEAAAVSAVLGASAGIIYVTTIDIGLRWYPEKKGIVTGTILSASAFAGLCWFRIGEQFIRSFNIQVAFITIGICSALVVIWGGYVLVNPPAGYVPPVWRKPENPTAHLTEAEFDLKGLLRSPLFYIISAAMVLISSSAIAYTANIQFMSTVLASKGLEQQLAERITLLAALIFAISDGMGRIAWGSLSDIIGFRLSLFALCAVEVVIIAVVSRAGGNGSVLIFGAFALGTALGGIMVIFPGLASEYLGEDGFTGYYSLVFAIFVLCSVGIVHASGCLRAVVSSSAWLNVILFSAAFPLAGAAALFMIKKSKQKQSPVHDEFQAEDEIEEKSYE